MAFFFVQMISFRDYIMLILLGHLWVTYYCIDVMHFSWHSLLLIWYFNKFNFLCLKTYTIMTYVCLNLYDHVLTS